MNNLPFSMKGSNLWHINKIEQINKILKYLIYINKYLIALINLI